MTDIIEKLLDDALDPRKQADPGYSDEGLRLERHLRHMAKRLGLRIHRLRQSHGPNSVRLAVLNTEGIVLGGRYVATLGEVESLMFEAGGKPFPPPRRRRGSRS
jgi:hypothetical protein